MGDAHELGWRMSLVGRDDAPLPDDELVAAAQLGDERAFAILYQRYRTDIRALCSRSFLDPHTTEDVTQETFLRAFRHISEFERGRPVWPWLATIAKRLCIDELRGITRRAALGRTVEQSENVVHDVTSEEAIARVERQRVNRLITRALAALRPRDRKVFVLQTIEGWSHERIAEHNGMSVHAVRNLAWRARRALRRSLGSERISNWAWIVPLRARPHRREAGSAWRRWWVRSTTNVELEGAVGEWAAALVLGIAAASAAFIGGPESPETSSYAGSVSVARPAPFRDGPVAPTPSSKHGRTSSSTEPSSSSPRIVAASMSIARPAEGAAAPPGAQARVELRSPGGHTLIWYEHQAQCGGQAGAVLPDDGPVRVVC